MAREVLRVVPASDPMQIAIMVDNSTAAGPYVPDIRRALPSFIEKLAAPTASGRRNEIALITLGNRPTIHASHAEVSAGQSVAAHRRRRRGFGGCDQRPRRRRMAA